MKDLALKDIHSLLEAGKIVWTEHVALRLRERNIKRQDVLICLNSGELIEQYPDDMPFPSCLISGQTDSGQPLHVVCSVNNAETCSVITAYTPTFDKWENDYKTRKAGTKQ
jgi:hypothetical protein